MSSPIMPVQGPLDSPGSTPQATTTGTDEAGALVEDLTSGIGALGIDVARGHPPLEVLEQISAAAAAAERLRESGYELRFLADSGERTRIELRDLDGNAVSVLSTSEALELVDGEPLPSWPG